MKAAVSGVSLMLLTVLFCGMDLAHGVEYMDNPARSSGPLMLALRDEEPQYPDANYDSGEQDRWPTLEELGISRKRMLLGKRGVYSTNALDAEEGGQNIGLGEQTEKNIFYGKGQLPSRKRLTVHSSKDDGKESILRTQNLENSLYNLLSTKSQLPSDRRNMEDLRDIYLAADLLKRHRLPRNVVDPYNNIN